MVLRQKRGENVTGVAVATASAERVPKRADIHTILVIGSGPIVIGQACEFDYSGTQALQGAARRGLSRSCW